MGDGNKKKKKLRLRPMRLIAVLLAFIVLGIAAYFGTVLLEKRAYPLKYTELIRENAAQKDLDCYFLTAVIYCESGFDPGAVSPAGATGLMQLMPDTARWIAEKLDMAEYSDGRLTEPEVSIRLGCWYIDYLMKKFDGDMTHVLAAYNAGPGTLQRWLEDESLTEGGMLTEIPYPETRNYVDRVERAYETYKRLYPKAFE